MNKFAQKYMNIVKSYDFLFSGDDSVTLPDSTQPEEPVGGIDKKN